MCGVITTIVLIFSKKIAANLLNLLSNFLIFKSIRKKSTNLYKFKLSGLEMNFFFLSKKNSQLGKEEVAVFETLPSNK